MLATLAAIPILGILAILQSAIFSRMPILHGTADVILLVLIAWALQDRVKNAWVWALLAGAFVSYMSALPSIVPLAGYLLAVGFAWWLRRRIWQAPILAMFLATFVGTLLCQGVTLFSLQLSDNPYPILQSLNLITLPSALLNLLLALPIYGIVTDLAKALYPGEENE
jgi:hypothetical protein